MFQSSSIFTDRSKAAFLLWILFCYLCFVCVCHTVLYVTCSLLVTCWESADLLALLYVMLSCASVTFPYGVLGQVSEQDCIDS